MASVQRKAKAQKVSRKIDIEKCSTKNLTFAATLKSKHIKLFVNIIKAMNFINNNEFQIWDCGIKYFAEESKSFQAIACLKKEFFSNYHLRLEDDQQYASFGVSLNSFTDLLTALLDNDLGSMNITFYQTENRIVFAIKQTDSGDTSAFKLKAKSDTIDDDDKDGPAGEMVTEYYIKTMHSIDPIDFTVQDPHLMNSLMLDSPDLLGILNDFDKSLDELEIKITKTRMSFKSVGCVQMFSVAKIKSDSETFLKYEIIENSRFIYKFKYFKAMVKGLALSSQTSIETHVNGTLKVQLMVKTEDEEASAIIEYNLVPSLPDSESEPEM